MCEKGLLGRGFRFMALSVAALFASLLPALAADQIEVKGAYAESTFDPRVPIRAANGAGLSADGTTHNALQNESMWMGNNIGNGGGRKYANWFAVDFGAEKRVGEVKVWNFNMKDYTKRGFKTVNVYVSTETDPLAVSGTSGTFNPDDGSWTKVLSQISFGQATGADGDPVNATFSLEGAAARWVVLQAEELFAESDDWSAGGGYGGLSEVRFYADETRSHAKLSSATVSQDGTKVILSGKVVLSDGNPVDVVVGVGTTDGTLPDGEWDKTYTVSSHPGGEFSFEIPVADLSGFGRYYVALGVGPVWSACKVFYIGGAAEIEWTGSGDGKTWSDVNNWDGCVPRDVDTAVFGSRVSTGAMINCPDDCQVAAIKIATSASFGLTNGVISTGAILREATASGTQTFYSTLKFASANGVCPLDLAGSGTVNLYGVDGKAPGAPQLLRTGAATLNLFGSTLAFEGSWWLKEGKTALKGDQAIGRAIRVAGGEAAASLVSEQAGNEVFCNSAVVTVGTNGTLTAEASGGADRLSRVVVEEGGAATGTYDYGLNLELHGASFLRRGDYGQIIHTANQEIKTLASGMVSTFGLQVSMSWWFRYDLKIEDGGAPVDLLISATGGFTGGGDSVNPDGQAVVKTGQGTVKCLAKLDQRHPLVIKEGAWYADGQTAPVTGLSRTSVKGGALLGGVGFIGGTDKSSAHSVILNEGETAQAVLAPGTVDQVTGEHVFGTLTVGSESVANTVQMNDRSTLRLHVGLPASGGRQAVADSLRVFGTLTIGENDTQLEVRCTDDDETRRSYRSGTFDLVRADGGIVGDFASVKLPEGVGGWRLGTVREVPVGGGEPVVTRLTLSINNGFYIMIK